MKAALPAASMRSSEPKSPHFKTSRRVAAGGTTPPPAVSSGRRAPSTPVRGVSVSPLLPLSVTCIHSTPLSQIASLARLFRWHQPGREQLHAGATHERADERQRPVDNEEPGEE